MSNGLSRFHLPPLDFGQFEQDEANYKKVMPKTRLSMELGRYTIRMLPALQVDAALTGGFPWLTVWQHSWNLAGKTNMAVCPRLHGGGPCPLCDEANMGNSDMVAKMSAVCNVLVKRFVPRVPPGQQPRIENYDPPLVLAWNIPAGVLRTFKEWCMSASTDGLPLFFDPINGVDLSVTKAPKKGAQDAKRDVTYTVEKAEVRSANGGTQVAQGPISNDPAILEHLLHKCRPLGPARKVFTAQALQNWLRSGDRPASTDLYMPDGSVSVPTQARHIRHNNVIDADLELSASESNNRSVDDDLPF